MKFGRLEQKIFILGCLADGAHQTLEDLTKMCINVAGPLPSIESDDDQYKTTATLFLALSQLVEEGRVAYALINFCPEDSLFERKGPHSVYFYSLKK